MSLLSKKIIQESILKITQSEQWIEYLKYFALCCNRYSIQNSLLLFSQFPTATYVAGKKQWQKRGRIVKDEVKPIILIAPEFEEYQLQLNGKNKTGKRVVGFKEIEVFDISQTDPMIEIATPFMNIDLSNTRFVKDQADNLLQTLCDKFNVYMCEMKKDDGLEAFYSYSDDKIFVNKKLNTLQKLKAVCHEVGHKLLHSDTILERALREIEAETFAFIVLQHFNLDTTSISADYIAQWSKTIEMERLVLRLAEMEKAVKTFLKKIERE